jgi:hypothetical protein
MTGHEVLISTAHIAATCSCGWTSMAVEDHAAKVIQGSAHMLTWHAVFVEATEDDGTTVLCWGVG